jgi:hypothetical protein
MMSPQNNVETESGEPSSYQHMEQTLSQAVSNTGQASRESMNEGGGCHAAGSPQGEDEQPPRQLEDSKKSVAHSSSDDNPQDDGNDVAHDHVDAPSKSPEMMSESSSDESMMISEDQARSQPENLLEASKFCSVDSYASSEQNLIVSNRCVCPFFSSDTR